VHLVIQQAQQAQQATQVQSIAAKRGVDAFTRTAVMGVDARRAPRPVSEWKNCLREGDELGLRQAEAGQLFGGGASAFSGYERGKTQPHKSTVLLLKLLDRPPNLLSELRAA
jgi:Antitoxin component of bacterial toxin-antitoxin system, MqsA